MRSGTNILLYIFPHTTISCAGMSAIGPHVSLFFNFFSYHLLYRRYERYWAARKAWETVQKQCRY